MNPYLPAIISAVAAIVVCLINNAIQVALIRQSNQRNFDLFMYRVEQLERKQDKHNEVIERTYHLEEQTALHEEKIKVANHRIDDLEKRSTNHE